MKWYKRDSDAFAFGTIGLSLEEIGAYTLILDAMYSRQSPLPDDDFYLRRIIHNCHHNKWKKIKQSLIAKGKIWTVNGMLHAKRVLKELENLKFTPQLTPPVNHGVKSKKPNKINKNGRQNLESRQKNNSHRRNYSSVGDVNLTPARSLAVEPPARSPAPAKQPEETLEQRRAAAKRIMADFNAAIGRT